MLGHELSNSLAPIKSIAGSLLARVEKIAVDNDVKLRDFRRGLGVIESRADALHRFVQSSRELAQLPPPQLRPVPLGALLERVVLLEQRLPFILIPGHRWFFTPIPTSWSRCSSTCWLMPWMRRLPTGRSRYAQAGNRPEPFGKYVGDEVNRNRAFARATRSADGTDDIERQCDVDVS